MSDVSTVIIAFFFMSASVCAGILLAVRILLYGLEKIRKMEDKS